MTVLRRPYDKERKFTFIVLPEMTVDTLADGLPVEIKRLVHPNWVRIQTITSKLWL
jgi:hypothetical protein